MKKVFIFVVLFLSAMAAQGQCTWNVRAGFGVHSGYDKVSYYNYEELFFQGLVPCGTIAIQCNIPISKSHKHTLSPTVFSTFNGGYASGFALFQYGYKIGSGLNGFFYPKIGFALGRTKGGFAYGGSAELAYEYKHLIVAVNYIPACSTHSVYAEELFYGLGLTIGYKF